MMKIPVRENKVGRLEIVFYVAVLLLGLGSVIGAWAFSLLIPLMLLAIVYGVLRDVRAIRRLKTQNGPAQSFETFIRLPRSSQGATVAAAAPAAIGRQSAMRTAQGSPGWVRPRTNNAERNEI